MAFEHEYGIKYYWDLVWLRQRREGKEVPVFDPDWYDHLQPVSNIDELTPEMFGVIDEDRTRYGWAPYNYRLNNSEVQRRAAVGLVRFTQDRSFDHLFEVLTSVLSEIPEEGDFPFRPPFKFWDLEKDLHRFKEAGDIEDAAQHTARVLFSPWPSYKIPYQYLIEIIATQDANKMPSGV